MIVLDCIIAIMLMISIVYSWKLNKKITEFKSNKNEFNEMIKVLDNAIVRTELGIEELKSISKITAIELNNKIDKAKFLSDDLAFMTDRAGILADKLEKIISAARQFEKFNYVNDEEKHPNIITKPVEKIEKVEPILEPLETIEINTNPMPKNDSIKKAAIETLLARISTVKTDYKRERVEN